MVLMASQITDDPLFVHLFVQAFIKENIKTHITSPLWRESTDDGWGPSQMTSSAENAFIS